jgi:hypothetical protein
MLATGGSAGELPRLREEDRMADYEAPEADVLEQEGPVADETAVDLEAPEADAAEQAALAGAPGGGASDRLPYDADEADAAEQARVVELDEDDYR